MSKSIGTFSKANDVYVGSITTLNLRLGEVRIAPVGEKISAESPDYRVSVDGVDLGVGWQATAKSGTGFVRVVIDDPSLSAAINANLVENREGKYSLLWNRAR